MFAITFHYPIGSAHNVEHWVFELAIIDFSALIVFQERIYKSASKNG